MFEEALARRFVRVYCALHQCALPGIEHIVYNHTFARRQSTPFFRVFAPSGPADPTVLLQVLARMHAGDRPAPADAAQCTRILEGLYEIRRDTDADLYCGDLVLHRGCLYDWSTRRLTLERIRRSPMQPKKRFLKKYCADLRHGVPSMNVRQPLSKTLLFRLVQEVLGLQPLPGTVRMLSHLLRAFNRLVNLLDGDLVLDAAAHRFGEDGHPDPDAQDLHSARREVLQWPRLRVFVCPGASLDDSVALSIMERVPTPEQAAVHVRVQNSAHRLADGNSSTAIVPVRRSARQRENGRRESLAPALVCRSWENMSARQAYLYEVYRWVVLQPLVVQAPCRHVLVVMPFRNEIKYPRSVLPYNAVVLTHRPIMWTGRGCTNGQESLLPGILHGGVADSGYIWLWVSGQRLCFMDHLYLSTNSYAFHPIRRVGAGACY